MTNFTTIDALALSTVTGGKQTQQPQPQNPNCLAFCGTTIAPKVTGIKTGPINYTSTDNSKPNYHGTGAGAKVELGNPLPIGEAT